MKIAILGTRGIPNNYGGFEQFAEYLSLGLVKRGHSVTVYNSHKHLFQEQNWNGVKIVHCYDPEERVGTAGQFVYDLNCILDTRKKNFDVILQLGYTSSSIWGRLLPKGSVITTNMDGLEWKRSKYSLKVRSFLRYAEKIAIKFSDFLISDSIGIQQYLKKTYEADSLFIPYGADLFITPDKSCLLNYQLTPHSYNMLIARLEPENSIETILDGVVLSHSHKPFLVIGNHNTKYGTYLKGKYRLEKRINFMGSLYDIVLLNNLRHFSNLYFHGHTVGGTNPSLLEAMASQALIAANRNLFNSSILGDEAYYFSNEQDVCDLLDQESFTLRKHMLALNESKIKEKYSWSVIVDQYENHFIDILQQAKAGIISR
jgi:glycosyltransferase involved in cell wall biosynthesis